ncbi:putative RND superfamily exporter protein [Undibacterium sp. GrIS 1.8]
MMPSSHSPIGSGQLSDFDPRSGSLVERLLFNHRLIVVAVCALITILLGWQASKLELNASFEKTIPSQHPYIRHLLDHQNDLTGLGNAVRIAVANNQVNAPGNLTIYDKNYLETLRQFSDEVFLLPGVNRTQMKSIWTPTTRWVGVTEDGLEGGQSSLMLMMVLPSRCNCSPQILPAPARSVRS